MRLPIRWKLRTIMAAVAVAAVVMGTYVEIRRRVELDRKVEAEYYRYYVAYCRIVGPVSSHGWLPDISSDEQPDDSDLAVLSSHGPYPEIDCLDLTRSKVTDAGLAHLAAFVKLQELNLTNTDVTDAGLSCLARIPTLETLNLTGTCVTDDGLRFLKRVLPTVKITH
ncbi:hypothetical protein [Aquisphaera insulae]|uniref:hypothetical protein n=1 Tax=Aquisphaera insulae TaxID=2712864 RepID=UPI0013ECA5ED|nr:hypothetical protein [Aquisphaera insulae]